MVTGTYRATAIPALMAMFLASAAMASIAAAQAPTVPTVEQLIEQLDCRPGQECEQPASQAQVPSAGRKRGFQSVSPTSSQPAVPDKRSFRFETTPVPSEPVTPAREQPAAPDAQVQRSAPPTRELPREQVDQQLIAANLPSVDLDVPFAPGKATLGPRGRAALDRLSKALSHPRLTRFRFALVGHTDGVGDPAINQKLSERRAAEAKAYLIKQCRIAAHRLDAIGRGQTEPKNAQNPSAPENRRVQVITQSSAAGPTVVSKSNSKSVAATAALTLEQLSEKAIEAAGGRDKLAGLTTIATEYVGRTKAGAGRGEIDKGTTIVASGGRASSNSTTFKLGKAGSTSRTVINEGIVSLSENDGPASEVTGPVATIAQLNSRLYELLEWNTLYKTITLSGIRTVNGERVYVVEKTLRSGELVINSYNAANFLRSQRVALLKDDQGNTFQMSVRYSNFKSVDGIQIPFSQILRLRDASSRELLALTTEVTSAKVNVVVPDSAFEIAKRPTDEIGLLHEEALKLIQEDKVSEAIEVHKRIVELSEVKFGPDDSNVANALELIGHLHIVGQGDLERRNAEAEPFFRRALAIYEKAYGPDDPTAGYARSTLANVYYWQRNWARLGDISRRDVAWQIARAEVDPQNLGSELSRTSRSEFAFHRFVAAAHHLKKTEEGITDALTAETFTMAQWAQDSETARSIAQMAARSAAANLDLAAIVRERQDLVAEWQRLDEAATIAKSGPSVARDVSADAAKRVQAFEIVKRIAQIDKKLRNDFPDHAAFASARPLTIEQVRADLRSNEALIMFLDTPFDTFVWVVTKTAERWKRASLAEDTTLEDEVTALRCGLDDEAWIANAQLCRNLLGMASTFTPKQSSELPFDVARSRKLYAALFGEVEDLIREKHLIVVPSGPLTKLPFQTLVKSPPVSRSAGSRPERSTAWLARDHALTVLPAVSSLRALRKVGKTSSAPDALIGFGNPLLDGNPKTDAEAKRLAALARQYQSCSTARPSQNTSPANSPRSRALRSSAHTVARQQDRAVLASLRAQSPLPETADELCTVAANLGVDPSSAIYLGARATEAKVKDLSASGALARHRIVHFATHGVVAGKLDAASEPGLILTPPTVATEKDDGYLTATEIASLKLDADWVILSACNTAAGGAKGADALSGIARAFFYAQARSLLVSHWEVDSDSTVRLITAAISSIARDPTIGRAEALRRAMLALIDDTSRPDRAHPAYWAPFIVVGEGGR